MSECTLSAKENSNNKVTEHSFGQKFILKKNTKYEFYQLNLRFPTENNYGYIVKFRIYDLIITFPGFSKTCTLKSEINKFIDCDIKSTTIYDDFEQYAAKCSNENDPSVPKTTDGTDGDTSDEMNGGKSDEMN
ncbi:hypothetical protein RF11_09889 [Thelohanellus kitauei]|uniref:Uncharacterized protein n=1 Tax=Thelohanellus kitauei TaxID=669202 RepID=A0A0C2MI46_THEKT|nr:hypothetical protein RF11_09889 [Thelohanellus kitauei]